MNFLNKKSAFAYSALAISMLAVEANAAAIQNLSASQVSDNVTQIRIGFDGVPVTPIASQQKGSNQLTLDFKDTTSNGLPREMPINRGLVKGITAVNSGSLTRLMVNLNGNANYATSVEGNTLVIKVSNTGNNSKAVKPAPAPAPQNMTVKVNPLLTPKTNNMSSVFDGISSVNYSGNKSGGNITIGLTNEAIPLDVQRQGNKLVVRTSGSTVPRHLLRQIKGSGIVGDINAKNQGQNGVITITMNGDFEYQAYQSGSTLHISVLPPKQLRAPTMEDKVYTGEPLSMEFQDVSIRTVLDVLSHFVTESNKKSGKSDFNIVAADNVQGNITIRLMNVPWDQALDIILKSKNLGMRKNGNVILVAPADELTSADIKQRQANKELDDLLPLRTEYIKLNYVKAADLLELLDKADSPGSRNGNSTGDTSLLSSSKGVITSDVRTNTIIIKDTSEGIATIRAMIEQIDVPVKQVMIEARIVTATESFSKEVGVQWGSTRNSTVSPLKADSTSLAVNLGSVTNGRSAFNVGLLSISDMLLDLTLSAMQAENRGEVISSPKILTADNQTAKISSGKQIPYQEAAASGATSVSFQDAALVLEATPNITPEGKISLKLNIENADTTGEIYANVPVIRKDSLNTNVLLEDGQTVVLGGVFRNTISNGENKVPFLGSVPGIGRLFKADSKQNTKEELLIFITPKLVNDNISRF